MNPLNTLERRGMAAISTDAGSMLIVAADQRNSMKAVMTDAPDGPGSIPTTELAAAKADLITFLASSAPAILLDPEVALPGVVDDGVLAARHRAGRGHGRLRQRGRRRPPLHPLRRRHHPAAWSVTSAATSPRCSGTPAPTSRTCTRASPTRSAT